MQRQKLILACMLIAALSEAKSTHKKTSVVFPPLTDCFGDFMTCQSSGRCIHNTRICDGVDDCGDNSDEPDSCYLRECADGELKCNNGQCINKIYYCYKAYYCADGTDFKSVECPHVTCAVDEFKCKHLSLCIEKQYVCNGYFDCSDKSDEPSDCSERQCAPSEARCNNGQCLNKTLFCKFGYRYPCSDGLPLSGVCDSSTCRDGWVPCSSGDMCVEERYLCDGDANCADKSDESSEYCGLPFECDSSRRFRCRSVRRCISKFSQCDTVNDCSDNSDEDESFCRERQCGAGEVRCPSGQCLNLTEVCLQEGRNFFCQDGTMLLGVCANFPCPAGHFRCSSGEKCVDESQLCDGFPYCYDGSDESPEHCSDLSKYKRFFKSFF